MNVYASEWDDAIFGSGNTSARFLYNNKFDAHGTDAGGTAYGDNNCPSVIQNFDWMSPAAKAMGRYIDEGSSVTARAARFTSLVNDKQFICPSSDLTGVIFDAGGLTLPAVVKLPSYSAAILFHYNGYNGGVQYETYTDPKEIALPSSYRPRVRFIGPPVAKIFLADGARYSDTLTKPDLNVKVFTTDESTQFADAGSCFQNYSKAGIQTHCWDRSLATGNSNANGGTVDARIYSFRHGTSSQLRPTGSYKMNAGFFDGHAELITDKDAMNPALWMPTGTSFKKSPFSGVDAGQQKDSLANYVSGTTYIAP